MNSLSQATSTLSRLELERLEIEKDNEEDDAEREREEQEQKDGNEMTMMQASSHPMSGRPDRGAVSPVPAMEVFPWRIRAMQPTGGSTLPYSLFLIPALSYSPYPTRY